MPELSLAYTRNQSTKNSVCIARRARRKHRIIPLFLFFFARCRNVPLDVERILVRKSD